MTNEEFQKMVLEQFAGLNKKVDTVGNDLTERLERIEKRLNATFDQVGKSAVDITDIKLTSENNNKVKDITTDIFNKRLLDLEVKVKVIEEELKQG